MRGGERKEEGRLAEMGLSRAGLGEVLDRWAPRRAVEEGEELTGPAPSCPSP